MLFNLGPTERILENIEGIIKESLPLPKLKAYLYSADNAKMYLLNKVTFYTERINVSKNIPSLGNHGDLVKKHS